MIRAFWWAFGGNITLHLLGGSKMPNGIISGWYQVCNGWDHVREPVIVCLPGVFLRGIFPERYHLPSGEPY